jgi:beta-phosphoglucomutase
LKHFLGALSPEEIREYGNRKDQILRQLGTRVEPINGIIEFLAELSRAGIKIGLATSAGRGRTDATLFELGLQEYFEVIVTGDDVLIGKPDPSIYRLAAARLNENPARLLAFEDAISGVQAALAAGFRCAAVASGLPVERLREAGAEFVISDFNFLNVADLSPLGLCSKVAQRNCPAEHDS